MTDTHFLANVLIFLAAAVAAVTLFRHLRVSPVLGYLAAGVLIGPYGLGLIRDVASVRGLAELGVVFLLFSIGLELSFARLRVMRGQIFGLGAAQVGVTGLAIGAAAWYAGLDARGAIVVGAALALSSTAIVLQLLGERGEIAGHAGRVALAILLFQDLAVVPLLVLVPQLGGDGASIPAELGLAGLKAGLALVLIVVVGRIVLRPVFRLIAASRLPELLIGLTLLVVLGAAYVTELAGLSLALGAFLAGLLLAETEFRHQVEADIQPFRGLLLSLFFMTVGMTIDLDLLASRADLIGLVVLGLLTIKFATITATALAFRLPAGLALRQGLLLAESGEFAFILLAMAVTAGVVDDITGRFLTLAVALTMALTPLLAWAGRAAEARLEAGEGEAAGLDRLEAEARDLRNHVLLLGFGRVGETVAELLTARQLPYIALERDPGRVAAARRRGLPVYFGDASARNVLRAAGADRARAVVVTLNDAGATARTVALLRARFPEMPIHARARDAAHCEELARLGATGVVPEIMEVSLQLGAQALKGAGLSEEDVSRALLEVRGTVPEAETPAAQDDDTDAGGTGPRPG